MEGLCEVNELKSKEKSTFKSKDRPSKLEYRYWLVVKLKAIECKKDFSLLFIFLRLSPGFPIFNISRRSFS